MSSSTRRALSLPLAALLTTTLLATVIAGCVEGRAPINRVQPGALAKTVFESEWYFQQTVVDTPYSVGFTFVGEQGSLQRITWEIQEDYLVARRSYEHIAGSEPDGISGDGTEHGAAVAMYRIDSHFDIRRDYNPLTGEELNVLVENSTDRPWFERDYIRVDWSQNLVESSDFLALHRAIDGVTTESVAWDVNDPNRPLAPRFEVESERGVWSQLDFVEPIREQVEYMDIVNKMFVRPESVHIEGFGDVPSCYLLYSSHLDCTASEITVRSSFLRVDHEDRDYQPMVYTGDRMERFGYFVTERAGYDDHYGVVESARFRFVNRHNLWQQSHRHDANGELVRCTAETAAAACGGNGSVCDLDWARARREVDPTTHQLLGACTLPYRERETRPITYYVSSNFPAELYPDAQHLSDEWNRAFVETVGSLRELECTENGGDAGACAAERMRADGQEMFVLCHSPVIEDDHDACGPVGTEARAGDLRYSLIGWVNDPHLSSPLGYGPSSADPLTGEIIMGNAFIYGAAMETLTTFARDIIAVLNDDLTEQDIASGAQVEDWIARMEAPGSLETGRSRDDHAIHVDGLDAPRIAEAMDFSWARGAHPGSRVPGSPAELFEAMEQAENALYRSGALGDGTDPQVQLDSLQGTDIERMMTTGDMRMAAGIDPELPVTDAVLAAASPLQGMSLANMRAIRRIRDRMNAEHCVLDAEFADDGLLGLARAISEASRGDGTMEWYGQTYQLRNDAGELDYERVRSMLRHPIFDAVTAHEVGHTIGLRHNFSGSYDALNYLPRYWELRDDGTMMPRAWDPMSEQEIEGRILEYQYSTVMDYGVNFVVTDSHGIGHYDEAAVKMGYGDLVEVFANAADPGTVAWWSFIQSAGWPVPLRLEAFTAGGSPSAYMYTEWAEVVGGGDVSRLEQRADVRYTSLQPDAFLARNGIADPIVDASGRPAVPFLFCSDEQADLNPDCLRYDQGADAYESVQTVIDSYWNYYIFTNYRRQRLGFNPGTVATRVHDRYFEKIQRANQIYALYRSVFEGIFGDSPDYDRFWTRPDGMGAWTTAVGAGFQLLTRVVTAPEPGEYADTTRGDGLRVLAPADFGDTVALDVDGLDGRYIETTWDFDAGYFWFDQLDRVGYFYDKVIALEVLVDPTTYFLGRDTDADIRQYQINFGSSFGPALTAFMEGLLAEDWEVVSPRRGTGGTLSYPDPLDLEQAGMAGTPIDPNASFSIQLYGAVYGMSFIPQTYDQTFLNRSRIFVRGGAESVELAPGTATVEFTDASSGLTYVAVSYPHPTDGHETGVGAAMLGHARALQAAGATVELRSFIDNIDVVRRLSARLGAGAQP